MQKNGKTIQVEGKVVVAVRDDDIVLNDFREADPAVVDFVRDADEAELACHAIMQTGPGLSRSPAAPLTSSSSTRLGHMTGELDRKVEGAAAKIAATASSLLDEDDGALPGMLEYFATGSTGLGDAFDEDSKTSLLGKFDRGSRGSGSRNGRQLPGRLDIGSERAPCLRMQRDLRPSLGRSRRPKAIG